MAIDIFEYLNIKPEQEFAHDDYTNCIFKFRENKFLFYTDVLGNEFIINQNPLVLINIIEHPEKIHTIQHQTKFTSEQVAFAEYLLGHITPNKHPRICRGFETFLYWMTDDMEEVASQARLPYEIFPNILPGESYTLQQIKENQL